MRFSTNALCTIAVLCLLKTMCSCTGRGKNPPTETVQVEANPPATGDTVSAIDADILSIHQDKKGNLWFGSDGKGVYRYDGKQTTLFTVKDGLCHDQVRRIREDKAGNIYFSTGNGISRFNGRDFLTLTKGEKATQEDTAENWEVKPDDIWFEAGDGVYRLDGGSLKYLRLPRTKHDAEHYARFPGTHLSPYSVYCTFKDSKGNVWMGTEYLGVCRFDGKTFTWFKEVGGAAARAIFEDQSGNTWLSNNGLGLFRYDGKQLINFTEEKGLSNPDFLSNLTSKEGTLARVFALADDKNGNLWIGTPDAGVWRYDGKKLTNFTTKDGLPSNSVVAIHKDNEGNLWFGTNGVCKFDGKTFSKFQ